MTAPAAALALARRWDAHENDDCAGINTVFAVLGVTSPLGRLLERHSNALHLHSVRLGDFASDHVSSGRDGRDRSPAAAGMIRHGLRRGLDRRRVVMTAAAHAALTAYLCERVALLEEIGSFWSAEPGRTAACARQLVGRHLRATSRALGLLMHGAPEGVAWRS